MFSSKRLRLNLRLFGNLFKGFHGGLLGVYVVYSGYVFLNSSAWVPDENNFIAISNDYSFFTNEIPLGYGAIYWLILTLGHDLFIARLFFLSFHLFFLLLLLSRSHLKSRWIITLLFLSFPYSVWNGKLIGPEILVTFLIGLSFWSKSRNPYLAFTFMGLAIGVKLSALFCVLYLITFFPLKKVVRYLPFLVIGIWLANPFSFIKYLSLLKTFLESADVLISNILSNSQSINTGYNALFSRIDHVLFSRTLTWDLVTDGSVASNIMHPVLILILCVITVKTLPYQSIALLSTGFLMTLYIAASPGSYGWYWFPIIPLITEHVLQVFDKYHENEKASARPRTGNQCLNEGLSAAQIQRSAVFAVIALNFLYQIPNLSMSVSSKAQQINNVNNYQAECVLGVVKGLKPTQIYFKSDFGTNSSHLEVLKVPIYWQFDSPIKSGKSVIILSSRLSHNSFFLDPFLANDSLLKVARQCGDNLILFFEQDLK